MTGPEPKPPNASKKWYKRASWRAFIVVIALVLFAGWKAGTFDHVLVNVGLNAKECARNGFGATFCGQELVERRQQQEQAKQEGEAKEREAEKTEEDIKRKSEEEQAKITREGEEAQRRIQQEGRESQEAIERSTESP